MKYPEPAVSAVIFNPDDEVLLCRSRKWGDKYVIPGGHVELGESLEDALRREVKEETGLEVYDLKLISLKECIDSDSFHEKKHFIFIDYSCRTGSREVVLNDEAQEYVWVKLDDIENYELGGVLRPLLHEMKKGSQSRYRTEIYYNY